MKPARRGVFRLSNMPPLLDLVLRCYCTTALYPPRKPSEQLDPPPFRRGLAGVLDEHYRYTLESRHTVILGQ